jgi:transposase-like protein
MKRKVNVFSDEFKYMVVQEYLSSDFSQKELLEKYSIRGNSSIINWMRKFGLKEGPIPSILKNSTTMTKGRKKIPEELALEAKVKELEKALEYEKLRSLALDTMIDAAERNLKISIRKKPGTKQ